MTHSCARTAPCAPEFIRAGAAFRRLRADRSREGQNRPTGRPGARGSTAGFLPFLRTLLDADEPHAHEVDHHGEGREDRGMEQKLVHEFDRLGFRFRAAYI